MCTCFLYSSSAHLLFTKCVLTCTCLLFTKCTKHCATAPNKAHSAEKDTYAPTFYKTRLRATVHACGARLRACLPQSGLAHLIPQSALVSPLLLLHHMLLMHVVLEIKCIVIKRSIDAFVHGARLRSRTWARCSQGTLAHKFSVHEAHSVHTFHNATTPLGIPLGCAPPPPKTPRSHRDVRFSR